MVCAIFHLIQSCLFAAEAQSGGSDLIHRPRERPWPHPLLAASWRSVLASPSINKSGIYFIGVSNFQCIAAPHHRTLVRATVQRLPSSQSLSMPFRADSLYPCISWVFSKQVDRFAKLPLSVTLLLAPLLWLPSSGQRPPSYRRARPQCAQRLLQSSGRRTNWNFFRRLGQFIQLGPVQKASGSAADCRVPFPPSPPAFPPAMGSSGMQWRQGLGLYASPAQSLGRSTN